MTTFYNAFAAMDKDAAEVEERIGCALMYEANNNPRFREAVSPIARYVKREFPLDGILAGCAEVAELAAAGKMDITEEELELAITAASKTRRMILRNMKFAEVGAILFGSLFGKEPEDEAFVGMLFAIAAKICMAKGFEGADLMEFDEVLWNLSSEICAKIGELKDNLSFTSMFSRSVEHAKETAYAIDTIFWIVRLCIQRYTVA